MRTSLLLALLTATGCATDAADPGITAQEIVGGTSTQSYAAVPLLYTEFADGTANLCSGTLISPRVVLTAAHCLQFTDEPTLQIAYFGSDATTESDPAQLDSIPIVDSTFDTDWNIEDLEGGHDVGLVLMERSGPVEPMGYNRDSLEGRTGDDVHLVGWGRTTGEGEDYGKKREVMTSLQQFDAVLMRYGSATANTCQGDSGGPNFMMQGAVEVVAGITSFGNTGCDQYGFGTNVAAYAESFIDPWLVENDQDACAADGACLAICGDGDPDCGGDPGGDTDDGSAGGAPTSGDVTGGCSAGGPVRGRVALVVLALVTLVLWRRRRRK
jgi:MYXO-CTERM domain-containing protein